MSRFFFHLHNRIGVTHDDEGKELPAIEEARNQARREIRSLLSEDVKDGVIDFNGCLEIANETGEVLDVVSFSQAVELRPKEGAA